MKSITQKLAIVAGATLLSVGAMTTDVSAEDDIRNSSERLSSEFSTKTFNVGNNVKPQTDFASLAKSIVTLVIVVAALLTLFYLVMGAIAWITSGGDKGKVEEARNKITAAVIGLLILAAVWAIFQLVLTIGFGSNKIGVTNFTN